MVRVVDLEPVSEQLEVGSGTRKRSEMDVAALQRLHEGLCVSIALWALHWCVVRFHAGLPGKDAGVSGYIGRAIVAERLGRVRPPIANEAGGL